MGKRRRNSGCEIRDSYSSCTFQIQGWRAEVERVESEASNCEIVYVFATPHREGDPCSREKTEYSVVQGTATD
jgi:hypothetical protein